MRTSNKRVQELEPMFANGRRLASSPDDEAAQRSALKKETARLIKEGAAFEASKAGARKKIMTASLVIAGISVILNLVLGIAISFLTPLKTVEPYLLMVDKDSGYVSLEQPLSKPLPTYGQVVDSHFLEIYVNARESHDWALAQLNYDTVQAFSIPGSVWNEFNLYIHSPKSPLAVLADRARVIVSFSSDPLIDAVTQSAVVRFTKTVVGPDGQPSTSIPPTYWIATIGYGYPNPKLKPAARRLNPLGMKIPSYQVVQEVGAR